MTNIKQYNQQLSQPNIVVLYELDASVLGGAVYRFTKRMNETTFVSFGTRSYTAIDIDAKGFTWDGKGQFPKPTLRVSNVGGIVTSAIISLKDMIGATLTRIRTYECYLDTGSEPDGNAYLPLDIFTVEQKIKQTKTFVEWRLSTIVDAMGVVLPGRPVLRDVCTRKYRLYDNIADDFDYTKSNCPYAGNNYFTENDRPTNKVNDYCSKRLSGCKARFGDRAELPTWAFPGVARY